MDNHFNTPSEIIELNMKASETKTTLPLGKMILLGIMAGMFIAFGAATSSTAAHSIENIGVSRALAAAIFPVGLMLIVFLGGELFTGNCLILLNVFDRRTSLLKMLRNLVIVYFSNLLGALWVDCHWKNFRLAASGTDFRYSLQYSCLSCRADVTFRKRHRRENMGDLLSDLRICSRRL